MEKLLLENEYEIAVPLFALETKNTFLLHYSEHLLFIPETDNAENGHIKQIHQVKNLRPV